MTARSLARPLALLAAGATFIAACGGGGATTAPTPTAVPSVAPATQGAAASGLPGFSFALPSGFNADPGLEALLPDTIAGEAVTKLSIAGDSFMSVGQGTDDLQKVLDQFGKSPSDLSVALGGTTKASVIAFRIKGVDANQMFTAFASAQGNQVASVTDVTISGKAAKKVVDSSATTIYLYATGDALITISDVNGGLTDPVLNEIFQHLP